VFFVMGRIHGWNVLACGVVQIASTLHNGNAGAVMRRDVWRP
jgi:hypothetical protein